MWPFSKSTFNPDSPLLTRRTIRRLKPVEIPRDHLDHILRAALCAPSANNERPWELVVISDLGTLRQISRIHPWAQMCREASLGIAVVANMEQTRYPPGVPFWVQDCAAMTQNILLACEELDYGATWLSIVPYEDRYPPFRNLLGLKTKVRVPFSVVAIGGKKERRSPHSDREIGLFDKVTFI